MAHFMAHHRLDPVNVGAVEQIVVERDPDGRAEPRDIGGNPLGLLRRVDHIDVVGRDVLFMGDAQYFGSHRPLGHRGIFIEQRLDEQWREHDHHREHRRQRAARPQPPALRAVADHGVDDHEHQRADDQPDAEQLRLLETPFGQGLVGHAVLMLAIVSGVDRPGQGQHRAGDRERDRINRWLEPFVAGQFGGPATPRRRPAEAEHQPVGQDRDQSAPQGEPVAAFEIGIGLGPRGAVQRVEIGARRGLGIERWHGGGGQHDGVDEHLRLFPRDPLGRRLAGLESGARALGTFPGEAHGDGRRRVGRQAPIERTVTAIHNQVR